MYRKMLHLAIIGLLPGGGLQAGQWPGAWRFGAQGGLALAAGDDLRTTTGTGLSLDFGVNATRTLGDIQEIRPRLDLLAFAQGRQDATVPLTQHLDTKVRGLAMGCEYLCRLDGPGGRWAAGGGLYLIRWSVASSNRVGGTGGGVVQASGSSHWTREGLGLVGTCRITPRLQAEARWISSHYGYENLPARFGTLGLLWRF